MALANILIGTSIGHNLKEVLGDFEFVEWLPIAGIGLLYFGLASGQGHMMSSYQGELFPSFGRAIGSGLLGVADALGNFMAAKSLPMMEHELGMGNMFYIFALVCVLGGLFVYFFVPETKGKTLEEVEEYYRMLCYGDDYDDLDITKRHDELSLYDTQSIWGGEVLDSSKKKVKSNVLPGFIHKIIPYLEKY